MDAEDIFFADYVDVKEALTSPDNAEELFEMLCNLRRTKGDSYVAQLMNYVLHHERPRDRLLIPQFSRFFLAFGADVNTTDRYGMSLAALASRSGESQFLETLLLAGSSVNDLRCSRGRLPIHYAAMNGHTACVRLLLRHGSRLDEPDGDAGYTPLHHAVYNNRVQVVQVLVDAGCDLSPCESKKQRTALQIAVDMGSRETIEQTLRAKRQRCLAKQRSFAPFTQLPESLQQMVIDRMSLCTQSRLARTSRYFHAMIITGDDGWHHRRYGLASVTAERVVAGIPGSVFFVAPLGDSVSATGQDLVNRIIVEKLASAVDPPPFPGNFDAIPFSGVKNADSVDCFVMDDNGEKMRSLVGLLNVRVCVEKSVLTLSNFAMTAGMDEALKKLVQLVYCAEGETFASVHAVAGGHALCGDLAFYFINRLAKKCAVLWFGTDRMHG